VSHTSWLTPRAELGDAGRKGLGIFAVDRIARGETVAGFGGQVFEREEFDRLDAHRRSHSIQIDADLYLVSPTDLEPADYANHSCEPNTGIAGNVLVVAMSDIGPGEEICFDYAMCDAADYDEFVCECATPSCRGLVTGADWKRPELQARYAGHFSAYLAHRIAAEVTTRPGG
jgi:SET domain-containing protein